ncbi:Ferredoxin:thioredoxin reductase [Bertholletia excelsa]
MASPASFAAAATTSITHHHNALVFNVSTPSLAPRSRILDVCARRRAFAPFSRSSESAGLVGEVASSSSGSVAVMLEEEEKVAEAEAKIGAKVRVKVPLKVYHVPRVPEVDLTGKEGVLKQYVGVWKGKRISANMPFKIEFVVDVEGRGPVKFFAHLKEDEFEYID